MSTPERAHRGDESCMRVALDAARRAADLGEVPVGAVVVDDDGDVLAVGANATEAEKDPTAHAELLALREAARRRGDWRLAGTTMYVTLEPCPMCAGAVVLARVRRLVYGAPNTEAGAAYSLYNIPQDPRLDHAVEVVPDVLREECAALLEGFFRDLR